MTIHLSHSGHVALPNGSCLRLDVELGEWCATYYRADRSVWVSRRGPLDDMAALLDRWQAAFEVPSTSILAVGGRSGVASTPTPDHQTARETA